MKVAGENPYTFMDEFMREPNVQVSGDFPGAKPGDSPGRTIHGFDTD